MFPALRHLAIALALGVCFTVPAQAKASQPGEMASEQARHPQVQQPLHLYLTQ